MFCTLIQGLDNCKGSNYAEMLNVNSSFLLKHILFMK